MKEDNFTPFADELVNALKIRNLSHKTIEGVGWRLGKFFIFLEGRGITRIDGITREVIKAYQVELYQCINFKGTLNTVSYQNNMLSAVKKFTRFLKERDYMVSDPSRDIQ